MSMQYYYLAASLPYLEFGGKPPVSEERFLGECEKWLTPRQMELIRAAGTGIYPGSSKKTGIVEKWERFDGGLKKALADIRRSRKKGTEIKSAFDLEAVLGKANPLETERALEKARWDFLESIVVGHFFDLDYLMVYYAKLRIMLRLDIFDKDKGENKFYELCEVSHESANG